MRYALVFIALLMFYLGALAGPARSGGLDLGLSMEDGKVKGFYLGVRDYYKVPEKEVHVIRERHLPDDEMPVAFFIARRARVAPSEVIEMRLQGLSWMGITRRYRLDPDIFYVPVRSERMGPPYGHAYGHYKHWRGRRRFDGGLSDEDVINLVNLRFLSERYKLPPERIISMRSGGMTFIAIDYELSRGGGMRDRHDDGRREHADREDGGNGGRHDHGRGHGRGHDREED